ncbi:DUF2510 domain-containing protein [Rhodococcus sp. MEB041]|uniref:DUF2510 domain-containing protein n=1 Tax=Rhodococcus sp. MEB041 TaxID=3040323 RepID=UPI00254E2787|nr:DUF2510 domain-containing protein [Rhodococcus sp. MEB041]
MTTPTPGWYSDPDPANVGGQRFWDGTQWTNQATPGASAPAPPPTAPGGQQGGSNCGLKIFLAIAAAALLLVGIGSVFGLGEEEGESDQALATTSESPASTTTRAPAAVPPRTTTPAPVPASAATVPADCLDVPSDVLAAINASLETSGYELGSPAAYDDGDTLYVAGEIVELQDGGIRSRDDVFAQQGPFLTPVTVTARNESNLLDLHDQLGLDFLDPGSQAAADCARTY